MTSELNLPDRAIDAAAGLAAGDADPVETAGLVKQAIRAFSGGKLDECERLARTILELAPGNPSAHHLLGIAYGQRGTLAEAIEHLEAAAGADPKNAEIQRNLGLTYGRLGEKDRAIASYRRAIELQPDDAQAHINLALLLHEKRDLAGAIASLQRAIEIAPNNVAAQYRLGQLLYDDEKLEEAAARFRRVLALEPDHFEAHRYLGLVLRKLRYFPAAIAHARRAVELKPGDAHAWDTLGSALQGPGRFEEAKAAYRRALEMRPDHAPQHLNLGNALQREGEIEDAIACYDRALSLAPDYDDARLYKAYMLLLLGRLGEGWKLYEARHSTRIAGKNRVVLPPLVCPRWQGEDLAGKTILLVTEQGFGDQIQFLRFVPLLAARGATVDVAVPRSLVELAGSVAGVRRASNEVPGHGANCDFWTLLLSLPFHLGIELDAIPAAVPYLRAPERSVRDWAERINAVARGRLRVGLAWAGRKTHGNDHNRSLRLEQLAPLLDLEGICFVGLQKDVPPRELWQLQTRSDIVDLGDELKSFSDTAAAMMNLDLVINVDTAIAHLAGALARPVWTLLPHLPDWRWLQDRDDSPWYPTMRLYRQPTYGDWASVVARVALDLARRRDQSDVGNARRRTGPAP